MLIIRRINCINTTSGICHCVSVTVLCAGRKGTLTKNHNFTNFSYHFLHVSVLSAVVIAREFRQCRSQ